MAVASFQDLCAGYCELAGVPTPDLALDAQGLLAFHVVVRGVTVNLVQRPEASTDQVFVLFEFGPIGDVTRDELHALLEANFMPLQSVAPVFSRNPATGDLLLQQVVLLQETTAHAVCELIEDGVDCVLGWREHLSFLSHVTRRSRAKPQPQAADVELPMTGLANLA